MDDLIEAVSMTDPTPLSPAAQAVMDAVHGQDAEPYPLIAAALRAAADQVVPEFWHEAQPSRRR